MKDERLEHLVDAHLNGIMNEGERRELEERLLNSAADRARFWVMAETHVLIHEGMQQGLAQPEILPLDQPKSGERAQRRHVQPPVWLQWRPLTAAAVAVFCTSVVWAYVGPYTGKAVTLMRESFESGTAETLPGLPQAARVWSGDLARVLVADGNVQPKNGTKMLRFISATHTGENAKFSAWGDVYQLVDLRGRVSNEKSVARLSASFNASRFSAGEDHLCKLELCALDMEFADAPKPLSLPWIRENSASTALRKFPMKGDGVWQEAAVEVAVSPQTRFILVHLSVMRAKPFPPVEPVQFSGHYVDDVKLELRTQPLLP